MKKWIEFAPFIAAAVIIAILLGLFAAGAFDDEKETFITSTTLVEIVEVSKLTVAEYVHHGIAQASIEGKDNVYILYYAIIKPRIEVSEIKFKVDNETKAVTVNLPAITEFDVDFLENEDYTYYYYPKKPDNLTAKEVFHICETDAKQAVQENEALMAAAKESLEVAITALFRPLLSIKGYTMEIKGA